MSFRDHFSRLAATYARHRPRAPAALFDYLSLIAPRRELAWDCGTGNGQAAVELARHFRRVVASDASREQIALAEPRDRVEYRVEPAERTTLPDGSVDLITVAVAVHWFLPEIAPAVDAVLHRLTTEILAPYWPEGFHHLESHYRSLPFPFVELEPPRFEMTARWSLDELAGFLGTWSAGGAYLDAGGEAGFRRIWEDLCKAWEEGASRRVIRWPLYLRVGRAS